jgi:hypothetical protein
MSNDETVTGIILARLERIEGKPDRQRNPMRQLLLRRNRA